MNRKIYSIPFYYDLLGIELSGVKITTSHVLLIGAIAFHDQVGSGCFASVEKLAQETGLAKKTILNIRSDLIKAGLLYVDRNKYGEITNMRNAIAFNLCCSRQRETISRQRVTHFPSAGNPTSEATPVLNTLLNNNNKAANASSSAKASSSALAADTKEEISHSPFDEKVDEVVSLKPGGDRREDKRAFAIASQVYKKMGLSAKPGVKMRDRIKRRLSEGYTQDDILNCISWCEKDQFYGANKSPMSWTSEEAMTQFKINQDHEKEVAKANNKEVRFKSTW